MSERAIFTELTDGFVSTTSYEAAIELIEYVKTANVSAEEIAYLAVKLGTSGETVNFQKKGRIADFASTGGPTSLSTLLCPLYLCQAGYNVISLGVPGRPAGGIDVLAQIHRYNIELTKIEIIYCLENCGYAHFLANKNYAPLDALLFKIRQESFGQSLPALVTASLLSKKIAVGVNVLGLDVRISPDGNFGKTWEEGRKNAQLFCEVAKILDIEAKCFLTDGRIPYQPYIGRGEALLALYNLFTGKAEENLLKHSELCFEMSRILSSGYNLDKYKKNIFDIFNENLAAQGSDIKSFERKVSEIAKSHSENFIRSGKSGYLNIDLGKIRTVLVDFQRNYPVLHSLFSDPAGLVLKKSTGEFVEEGDVVASFRGDGEAIDGLKEIFTTPFSVTPEPLLPRKMEVIENA